MNPLNLNGPDFGTFGPLDSKLGGRSGNLAWHAPTNDYRKTKFPYRKTRIAVFLNQIRTYGCK